MQYNRGTRAGEGPLQIQQLLPPLSCKILCRRVLILLQRPIGLLLWQLQDDNTDNDIESVIFTNEEGSVGPDFQ